MKQLNPLGQRFAEALLRTDESIETRNVISKNSDKVHVVGAGGVVTAAYEQLRNAAENSEEHLLLQKAIKRFYKRLFLTQSAETINGSADELVTELTFAGYIQNDSVAENTLQHINTLASEYHKVYIAIQNARDISNTKGESWAIDPLAVKVSLLFLQTERKEAFVQFAFDYFKQTIDIAKIFNSETPADFDPALYAAIHRALMKSDAAMIRTSILRRYQVKTSDIQQFYQRNQEIDQLLNSATAEKLTRYVDRQGAPLRIVSRMIESNSELPKLLVNKNRLLGAFEDQVNTEYASINKRINHGIIKSVLFLIITKFLVGIAIEVPYDIVVHGSILWLPLLFNLFFPPLYMVVLRSTLTLPAGANTARLVKQAESIFYGDNIRQLSRPVSHASFGFMYNALYVVFCIAVFVGVSWLLIKYLQFEIPHLAIFFIFLSGASFLGFRLSRMIRELESVDSQQNGMTVIRDFLYMPFVVVGRWISEKYSQVNFVALALDMMIELPLKTVLRLVRQWSAFISTKKDQL